jgi:hypothetical protein
MADVSISMAWRKFSPEEARSVAPGVASAAAAQRCAAVMRVHDVDQCTERPDRYRSPSHGLGSREAYQTRLAEAEHMIVRRAEGLRFRR